MKIVTITLDGTQLTLSEDGGPTGSGMGRFVPARSLLGSSRKERPRILEEVVRGQR